MYGRGREGGREGGSSAVCLLGGDSRSFVTIIVHMWDLGILTIWLSGSVIFFVVGVGTGLNLYVTTLWKKTESYFKTLSEETDGGHLTKRGEITSLFLF